FVSDRMPNEKSLKWGGPEVMKSINNIWKISERGGAPVQVTHHTSGNLFFPSISADGKTIVYEENFGLWKLDTASGKSTQISIDIKSDVKDSEVEVRTIQNEAEGFNLSPTTKRAAISTHGEIFTIATERGEVQRVTESPWREEDPRWSPNGKWIAFTSDRTGRQEVWIADEHGRGLKQLSNVDCDKQAIVWTPDGKKLLLLGGVGAPSMSALNRTTMQLYSVSLTHVEKNPDDRDVDTEEQAEAALEAPRRSPGAGAAAPRVEVKIEWDGLDRRMHQLTRGIESVMQVAPSPDSRTYAFVAIGGIEEGRGGPAIYTIGDDGTRLTRVSQSAPSDPAGGAPRGRGGFGGGGFGEP